MRKTSQVRNIFVPSYMPLNVLCLRKFHIRGALTTSIKWYFVMVDLNADGDGAKYWISELIEWKTKRGQERLVEGTSDESNLARVAGMLSSWVSMFDPVVSSTRGRG